MNRYDDHREVRGGVRSVRGLRRVGVASAVLAAFVCCALIARPARGQLVVAPPKADLDQARNGTAVSPTSPVAWVNGNAGASNSHYVEGHSIPYRLVMTDLTVGQKVIVQLAYDIKHSDKHAIDYITHYNRLQPHTFTPAHAQETVDPTIGVLGGSPPVTDTEPIPAPSSASPCLSPTPGQPTASFNALPAGERVMSLWNGNFNTSPAISYVSEGCLTDATAQTVIEIRFTTTATTAILAWGGHIGTSLDWGAGNSAGGISGSPYHTRTITWNKNNIGNQDRSLSAAAVECFCCTANCNDNNACTSDSCDETTNLCINAPLALSTPCSADANLCTIDHCNGAGACVTFDNVVCQAPNPPCEGGSTCNPATGLCVANPDAVLSTPCQADGSLCTNDHCNGTGTCVFLSNVTCQAPVPPCEGGSTCNPATGLCVANQDAVLSTPCEADGDRCTNDHCNGSGSCVFKDDVVCPADTQCATYDCNPVTGVCDVTYMVLSTVCERDGNKCTRDHCDGGGNCVFLSPVVCAGGVGVCEAGERCDPADGLCKMLPDAPLSTPCEEDMNFCTIEHCDGNGFCVFLRNVTCAPAVPPCEGGEYCQPTTGACLDNPDAVLSTPCQADMDLCTNDHCDGLGSCVLLSIRTCPGPVPPCEGGANCNPSTGLCVDKNDAPLSTPCEVESPANLCTNDHCDGLGNCVFLSLRTCQPAIPPCEGGANCNPSTGLCVDKGDAPLSAPCEVESPANLCTNDHCDGLGNCVFLSLRTCPGPVPPCEGGANCNPTTGTCVDKNDAPLSTPCEAESPANLCTNDHCDGLGNCTFLSLRTCPGPVPPCEGGQYCQPTTGTCVNNPDAQLSTVCERGDPLGFCTNDHCDGFGNCVLNFVKDCPDPVPPCEAGANCAPFTGLCGDKDDPPFSTFCEDDTDPCTTQHCDGSGDCVLLEYLCGACCDREAPGGVCTGPVFPGQCIGDQLEFFVGEDCTAVEDTGRCEEHRGACCDAAQPGGACTDNVLPGDCVNVDPEDQLLWFKRETCAAIEARGACAEHTGACCDQSQPGGACTSNVPASQCNTSNPQVLYFKDESCTAVEARGGCPEHAGVCCDRRFADPAQRCRGDVAESLCIIDDPTQMFWLKGAVCADVDAQCQEHDGACCDMRFADPALRCRDNVPSSECVIDDPSQVSWYKFTACADITCDEHTGACCDEDSFGSCQSNVPASQCNCKKCVFYKDLPCEEIVCVHKAIPTMSQWGLAVLTLLLLIGAKVYFGRRQVDVA